MQRVALNIAWVITIVYGTIPVFWIAMHPLAAYWRRRTRAAFPILVGSWFTFMALAGAMTFSWRERQLYATWVSWLLAAAFVIVGISVYHRIGRGFGGARLVGRTELSPAENQHELVTTGMHARVRHPFYLAHFCMLTGWTVGAGTVAVYALWVFGVVSGAIMIRMEDAELEQRFGDAYREYRRRVPALLPRL